MGKEYSDVVQERLNANMNDENGKNENPQTTAASNSNPKHPSAYRKYGPSLLLLIIVFMLSVLVVKKFKNPMRMTLLESGASMDMESMGGQTGYLPVEIVRADRGTVKATLAYSGTVVPYTEQLINPRVTGKILDIPVYPGDRVKPGQLLVRLDSDELSSQLQETRFEAKSTQEETLKSDQELEAAKARKTGAEAELKIAAADLKYWQEEIKRQKTLYTHGAISRDEYEMSQSRYAAAKASRDKAQAMVREAGSMLQAARLNQSISRDKAQQAKSREKTSKIIQDYTSIRSPIKGYVSERLISPGTLVEPGMTILKLVETDRVRVQANLPASQLEGVKVGNPVRIYLRDKNIPPVAASISSIFPAADPLARTVVVETIIPNPQNVFKPGDFVSVEITGETREDVIRVPQTALYQMGSEDSSYLWVYQPGTETAEEPMKMDSMDMGSGKMEDRDSSQTSPMASSKPDSEMAGMNHSTHQPSSKTPEPMSKPGKSSLSKVSYTCLMHPEVISDKPGNCPLCGMTLVKKETPPIPMAEMKSSGGEKLPSGAGSVILRRVIPGISEGSFVEIREGLEEGEFIISRGGANLQEGDKVFPVPYGKNGEPAKFPPPPPMKPGSMHHSN